MPLTAHLLTLSVFPTEWKSRFSPRIPYASAVVRQARAAWNWTAAKMTTEWGARRNPWKQPSVETPVPRTAKRQPWEVRAFCEMPNDAGGFSLALAAMFSYELGQRTGTPGSYARKVRRCRVRVTQNKTGKEPLLPVSDAMAYWLAKASRSEAQR
jgi:hypothetical protein